MSEAPSDRRATFDRLHAHGRDPWDLENSAYERAKRETTIAALGSRRFVSGLEVGCSIGTLSERLATLCDRLLAIDVSEVALAHARTRFSGLSNVALEQLEIPAAWPGGNFDLIVFSEVLYFLSPAEIRRTSQLARRSLSPQGVCLLVNWTGPNDLPVNGEQAVRIFLDAAPWITEYWLMEKCYQLHCLC